jgi:hypothetical protein
MKFARTVFSIGILAFSLGIGAARAVEPAATFGFGSLNQKRDFYHDRYRLGDTSAKLTDNRGNGYDALYGTRNLRFVLEGVLYRGGANNSYFHDHPRPNQNPLPTEGLTHLCEEGFENAVYLYSTNFDTAPHEVHCQTSVGGRTHANTLHYRSLDPLTPSTEKPIFQTIHDAILNPARGPVYAHCWNGWHASGFLSATSLIQFCDLSNADAVAYWNKNTDGHDGSSYERIRTKIRQFKPFPELELDRRTQAEICPSVSELGE